MKFTQVYTRPRFVFIGQVIVLLSTKEGPVKMPNSVQLKLGHTKVPHWSQGPPGAQRWVRLQISLHFQQFLLGFPSRGEQTS